MKYKLTYAEALYDTRGAVQLVIDEDTGRGIGTIVRTRGVKHSEIGTVAPVWYVVDAGAGVLVDRSTPHDHSHDAVKVIYAARANSEALKVEPDGLTGLEVRILAFERQYESPKLHTPGVKDNEILRQFPGMKTTHYYQHLYHLINKPAAEARDPHLVRRLQDRIIARKPWLAQPDPVELEEFRTEQDDPSAAA